VPHGVTVAVWAGTGKPARLARRHEGELTGLTVREVYERCTLGGSEPLSGKDFLWSAWMQKQGAGVQMWE
jgi:hypothetical protein